MTGTNFSEQIVFTDLHHAYTIEAPREEGMAMLRALLEGFGVSVKDNPDFHEYVLDVFLLEHAHMLRREQSMHGVEGAKKIFLVAFNTMLSEAQNALLKTLEEPTEGTHFFFITGTSRIFLPTLLSRMQVIAMQSAVLSPQSSVNAGEKFLAASVSERLKMVDPFIKAKPEEKSKAKEDARTFLESLEHALYSMLREGVGGVASSLEHVLSAKHDLSERSPSMKLLFEHLALTVPVLGKKS